LPKRYGIIGWREGLGLFGKEITSSLSKTSRIWLSLCGITLWTIRIERIVLIFSMTRWDEHKVQGTLWHNNFDYARIAWEKTLKDSENKYAYDDVLAKFDMGGGK
jgi:hypothetical protein